MNTNKNETATYFLLLKHPYIPAMLSLKWSKNVQIPDQNETSFPAPNKINVFSPPDLSVTIKP